MNKLYAIVLFAAACLIGCAGTSGMSVQKTTQPRSAQYTLALDWDYPLTPGKQNYLGASPLELGHITSADGNTYIASSLGKVIALDETTVQTRWTQTFEMPVTAGPVITAKGIFIALEDGAIVKLNPKTGEIIWRYETGVAVEKSLTVKDNLVACVNANNRVFVLDEATGTLKWRKERPKSHEFSMYGQSAPLIDDDIVYAGFSDGFLIAYAAANGTAIWSRELAPNARFKDLDVQPVRIEDTLYVATSSGGLYALDIQNGQTIWQRDIYGISSIRAFQDSLYISSQSGIFRIHRPTGETIWQNVIQKEALISELALGKNYIYASVQRYGMVILDRVGGELLHVIDMGSDFTAPPELTHGAVTAFSNRSTVYRFIVDDMPL